MEIKQIQKTKTELRTVQINIRTFKSYSKWMKKNNVSPSKAFNKTIEELMAKDKKKNKGEQKK